MLTFRVDDSRVAETYSRPIRERAVPYALVHWRGPNLYAVISASTNEWARSHAERWDREGKIGIRIYLAVPGWFGQVHVYRGGENEVMPWPDHETCIARTETLVGHR